MPKLFKIIYQSFTLASRQPYWWLLALLQSILFSAIGQFAKPFFTHSLSVALLSVSVLAVGPVTVWLWQSIFVEIHPEGKEKQQLIKKSIAGECLIVPTALFIIAVRFMFAFWPLHTLVFAIVASTSGLALLYLALCGQTLYGAVRLAIYTWNKRISFTAAAASVLLVAHGIAFVLVKGVFNNLAPVRVFPVFGQSVTIWVLLTVLVLIIGYFSSILNTFVVILFLESIATKKDPEVANAKSAEAVILEVS